LSAAVRKVELVHPRCAGIDISKKDAKVCVRVAGAGRRKTVETVTTWGSMTNRVLALRDHLIAEQVTCAVMEATGDYWKPFYYLLEDAGFELLLVNARHVKNLPGRKSDPLTELRDVSAGHRPASLRQTGTPLRPGLRERQVLGRGPRPGLYRKRTALNRSSSSVLVAVL
jgi:Transposase